MSLLKFASIKLTLLLIAGILLGSYFEVNIVFSGTLTSIALVGLGISFFTHKKRKNNVFGILTIITTISLGLWTTAVHTPENDPLHFGNTPSKGPELYTLKITETLKPSAYYSKYIAEVKLANHTAKSGKVLLHISKDSTSKPLAVDDVLRTYGMPKTIPEPLNPYSFNYKKYMERLGVLHQLNIVSTEYLLVKNSSITLFGFASTTREKIIQKLKKAPFGDKELSIIQALLLGQRQDISTTTYDQYKKAGAMHILAVSGLHIGILLLILEFLLQPIAYLPNGKKIKLGVLVFLLWGFALLAGFSASIIRATTMFTFVAYALYLNRPSNTFNILALSMGFILLVINPNLIFQVGFQMSYAAVFAIAWIYPMLQRFWFPKHQILNKIWQLVSVSIAAQLGVFPISLFYFHQFPGLFFVSNLVIIPFLGIILGLGLCILLLASINYLPNVFVYFYNFIIGKMNAVIAWVAEQEAFIFTAISFPRSQLLLSYIIVFFLVASLSKPSFKKVALFLCSCILFQVLLIYQEYQLQKEEQVWVLHQNRNSVVLHQNGSHLNVFSMGKKVRPSTISRYKIEKNIDSTSYAILQNSYRYTNTALKVVDSSGVYINPKNPSIYLLSNSPKVNLDRFIDSVQPIKIIADGSTYKSYINRWKKTCEKRKIPFHYTGEKGAYYLSSKN